MSRLLFSIVIPTLNEEKYLPKLMESLTHQTLQNFEVILVDAHSTDNTVKTAKKYEKKFPLTIVSTEAKNVAISRNTGAKKASGEFIFFIDADNDIGRKFLEEIQADIADKKVDAIIPRVIPSNNKMIDRISYRLCFYTIWALLPTPRPFSTGGNIIIKKSIFDKSEKFNPNVFIGEDHDIIRSLKKISARIIAVYNPYVIYETRRFDQNRFQIYIKYAYAFLYLLIHSKIEKKIYNYSMGGNNFPK